jgi:hypothetical protein
MTTTCPCGATLPEDGEVLQRVRKATPSARRPR